MLNYQRVYGMYLACTLWLRDIAIEHSWGLMTIYRNGDFPLRCVASIQQNDSHGWTSASPSTSGHFTREFTILEVNHQDHGLKPWVVEMGWNGNFLMRSFFFFETIEDAPTWTFYRTWKMMGFSAPTFSSMDIFSSVPLLERQRCQKCSRNSRGEKSLRHLHFGLAKAIAPYMARTHPEPPVEMLWRFSVGSMSLLKMVNLPGVTIPITKGCSYTSQSPTSGYTLVIIMASRKIVDRLGFNRKPIELNKIFSSLSSLIPRGTILSNSRKRGQMAHLQSFSSMIYRLNIIHNKLFNFQKTIPNLLMITPKWNINGLSPTMFHKKSH